MSKKLEKKEVLRIEEAVTQKKKAFVLQANGIFREANGLEPVGGFRINLLVGKNGFLYHNCLHRCFCGTGSQISTGQLGIPASCYS